MLGWLIIFLHLNIFLLLMDSYVKRALLQTADRFFLCSHFVKMPRVQRGPTLPLAPIGTCEARLILYHSTPTLAKTYSIDDILNYKACLKVSGSN